TLRQSVLNRSAPRKKLPIYTVPSRRSGDAEQVSPDGSGSRFRLLRARIASAEPGEFTAFDFDKHALSLRDADKLALLSIAQPDPFASAPVDIGVQHARRISGLICAGELTGGSVW